MIPMDIQKGEKVLLEIKELMDELNVIFFLRHGTCLAAVRDGQLIKWDDDLDIGSIIGMNGLNEKSIYETVDKFKLAGFEVEAGESSLNIQVTLCKFGISADWTCYKIFQGSIYQYPVVKIPVELHDDLKPISFLGATFFVPNPPEKYLELKYGSEWQIPKEMDYEGDIINSIPESVILQQSCIFTRIHKFFFPNKYITKIRILTHDNKPVELAKVTLVGIGNCTTDYQGYAKFDLISKRMHFKDEYAVMIETKNKEKEILFQEVLKPGLNYDYLPDKDHTSGRLHVLKEQS
jgi:hypothetical protein